MPPAAPSQSCQPSSQSRTTPRPKPAMMPKIVSAHVAPNPEARPNVRPSNKVRRTHSMPTGPTGSAMTTPTAMPLRKRDEQHGRRPRRRSLDEHGGGGNRKPGRNSYSEFSVRRASAGLISRVKCCTWRRTARPGPGGPAAGETGHFMDAMIDVRRPAAAVRADPGGRRCVIHGRSAARCWASSAPTAPANRPP